MKDNLPRYTLRISKILLDKLGYVAEYEGRTKNREIEQLIKKKVAEFEKEQYKNINLINFLMKFFDLYCIIFYIL